MSNKKIFKEVYSKKINKDNNYKKIIECIERDSMKKNNKIVKWAFVPVCLLIIMCGVVIIDNYDKTFSSNDPIINKEKNYEIYINSIEKEYGLGKADADIQRLDFEVNELANNQGYEFLKNIIIPKDLTDNTFNAIYVKETKESDNYSILNNYEFWYENSKNGRKIVLSFSNEYEPIRDYFFDDNGSKISKINDIELTIYKYKNSYMAKFKNNGINFDIETSNITESELIDLLTSIIK